VVFLSVVPVGLKSKQVSRWAVEKVESLLAGRTRPPPCQARWLTR